MLRVPQLAHVPVAVVISVPKTATRVPAIAFPSSASMRLASGGAESFGPDAGGFVAEGDEGACGGLHESRRAADVDERALARRPVDLVEEFLVDPAAVSAPSLRLLACEGEADVDRAACRDGHQLVTVDDLWERARRVQQPHRHRAFDRPVVTQDRPERYDAGAAGEELKWSAQRGLPDEVATDGAAQLQVVPDTKLIHEIRRDLAVLEPFDRDHDTGVFGRRGDRVAPLRLVAVLRRQPHVDVLAGAMARPVWQLERDALRSGGLFDELDHGAQLPGQSPRYRCSFHGSP